MEVEDLFIENVNKIQAKKRFIKELVEGKHGDTEKAIQKLQRKYKINLSKVDIRKLIIQIYGSIPDHMINSIIKCNIRSLSGVLVVTVVLKPGKFSCNQKCSYCPTETDTDGNPTQPKSYLSSEPAMRRALQHNFDIKEQFWDRIRTYEATGNFDGCSGKIEVIISGGTWEHYPYEYRKQVITEIYWAANSYHSRRESLDLESEIKENEYTPSLRIIGLTIETRPDNIRITSIKEYRLFGITRIQLGVQHYSDYILEGIRRGCNTDHTIRAIRLLKNAGFKVVCHLMPDLPNSDPALDVWMFDMAVKDPDLQFDDVKIYPTAICKSDNENIIVRSEIMDWYEKGLYTPYGETNLNSLIDVIISYKEKVQPYVRIQRVIRDIPSKSIASGYEKKSNLRQMIANEMEKQGKKCQCIRCMEVRSDKSSNRAIVVREYEASGALEVFISVEAHEGFCPSLFISKISNSHFKGCLKHRSAILGFCRLRLGVKKSPVGLDNYALIRELHVYGKTTSINEKSEGQQHKGIGSVLMKKAEEIAYKHGHEKIAVISGVGSREYYRKKHGYELSNTYMVKTLTMQSDKQYYKIIIFSFIFVIFSFFML